MPQQKNTVLFQDNNRELLAIFSPLALMIKKSINMIFLYLYLSQSKYKNHFVKI